ncbi:MAG: HRDC domain-containing protein [Sporichthyaceae bacterium]
MTRTDGDGDVASTGVSARTAAQDTDAGQSTEPAPVPLLTPADGVPAVVQSAEHLAHVVAALAAGTGPVAVDAERASGYRYGQRAYLLQLRRAGAGTVLIDPIACPDLGSLAGALSGLEWVFHAASQDIPCLAELGLHPSALFDTELAARLLGYPRVGLGSMVETVLGLSLEKGHSAVDWSVRPLPEPWLRYAALDVEVLIDLRDEMEAQLVRAGKAAWARQEFEAIVAAPASPPRVDPWRRVSGLHRVRRARQLAIVRSLWETRDRIAIARDIAPGRVLPDSAIVEAALSGPADIDALCLLPVFGGRATRRAASTWFAAIESARALPERALPPVHVPATGPPPPRSWPDRDPAAAVRLSAMRTAVCAVADAYGLPVENLIAPDSVRRIAWSPPADTSTDGLAGTLSEFGARPWQIELTAGPLAGALANAAPPEVSTTDEASVGEGVDAG